MALQTAFQPRLLKVFGAAGNGQDQLEMFPKIVVPPNHPLKNRVFPLFSPFILGPTLIFGNTQLEMYKKPSKTKRFFFVWRQ